jgi:hypothetical protein
MTRMCGWVAATSSKRAGVSSVEPSSTMIASNWSVGRVWLVSDVISGSTYAPALYDATTTLILIPERLAVHERQPARTAAPPSIRAP